MTEPGERFAAPPAALIDALSARGGRVLLLGHVHPDADVLGTRVVWEDQRSGNGDVHMIDLAGGSVQVIISGRGHSATPRLISDGLLWIEAQNNRFGLVRARWR